MHPKWNPQAMQNFQKVQGDLSVTLSRLRLVVSGNYPQPQTDVNFVN
jgi:hypothetical protein